MTPRTAATIPSAGSASDMVCRLSTGFSAAVWWVLMAVSITSSTA
jgi:hypothetical protein